MSLPSSPEPDLQKGPHPESQELSKNKVSPVKWLHPSFTETPVKWLYPESEPGSDTSFEMTDETKKQDSKGNDPTVEDKKQTDEKSTTDDDEIDVGEEIQNISKEVTAAASYLGSMFSSAISKTATVASEATSNVKASGFFSAIGGPIKPDDDDAQPMRAEDVKEVEEVPPLPASSSTTFFANAWSKVGSLAMSTSWAGGDATEQVKEEGENKSEAHKQPARLLDNLSSVMTSATSALQQTVVKPSHMISEFNREHEKFLKEKAKESGEVGVAPWVGYRDEEAMKKKILALSEDKRTFVRPPPSGVSFDFDYKSMAAAALVLLNEDENLPKMRYELVPKAVKEIDFWKNYFYRVSLIKQSFELKEFEEKSSEIPTRQETVENRLAPEEDLNNHSHGAEDEEFISDTYQASADDMAEVDASMKTLGVGKKTRGDKGGGTGGGSNDEEWEAELEGELNEFEVVSSKDSREESPEWESQIQEMLDAEEK